MGRRSIGSTEGVPYAKFCALHGNAPSDPLGALRGPMTGSILRILLPNLPAVLFAAALVIAGLQRGKGGAAERFLSWILLLPVGVTGLWAGTSHVFFAATAAAHIGWQTSPFQFEVGMADFAIGTTAVVAFWRDLSFKAAAVLAASIFLLGDAVGHVRQMLAAGNFAPGNAGVPFFMDVICPVLSLALLSIATTRRRRELQAGATATPQPLPVSDRASA